MTTQTVEAAEAEQTTQQTSTEVPAYRMFRVTLAASERLCPSVLRLTFTGDDLDRFADNGFDQRIKFFLPITEGSYDELLDLEASGDWYGRWRGLPDERRHPLRTYTARSVRRERREVDVDVVLHGDLGPASRWAGRAVPGDELVILGPNADAVGPHGGLDFVPPARADRLLIAGDETALPAIAGILERLPADARGEVLIEMPFSEDRLALDCPVGVVVTWCGRDGRAHGSLLEPAVRAAAARLLPGHEPEGVVELEDVDEALLWETPVDERGYPLRQQAELYAWLAGESGVIKRLRRHLVTERGVDRKAVAFMGYWRAGHAEGS